MNKKIWVYAGTFDPITKGHEALIMRAASLCDELIVAVVEKGKKQTLFSAAERRDFIVPILPKNARVEIFSGLLVDWAKNHNASALIRGLRDTNDWHGEQQLANINAQLGLDTLFLISKPEEALISSTLVKELASLGGNTDLYLRNEVSIILKNRLK